MCQTLLQAWDMAANRTDGVTTPRDQWESPGNEQMSQHRSVSDTDKSRELHFALYLFRFYFTFKIEV